jgi:hypothetical protein
MLIQVELGVMGLKGINSVFEVQCNTDSFLRNKHKEEMP